jgi:hypothetical protein
MILTIIKYQVRKHKPIVTIPEGSICLCCLTAPNHFCFTDTEKSNTYKESVSGTAYVSLFSTTLVSDAFHSDTFPASYLILPLGTSASQAWAFHVNSGNSVGGSLNAVEILASDLMTFG